MTGAPFPEDEGPLLRYIATLQAGQAKRTKYYSALAALRFFEIAGERPEGEGLHKRPALVSAVKEAAAEAARKDPSATEKRQAPPLLLRQLVELEGVVVDPSR